jgi:hypothetical protein
MEYSFLYVTFSNKTNFSDFSECMVLKAGLKSKTTKELEEAA